MKPDQSFLLLRARVREDQENFSRWFRSQHLREVGKIPGISSVEWGETPNGTQLGIYSFENTRAMQGALESAEAAYSRGTWAQWAEQLEEFNVEMQLPLSPPTLSSSNN